MPRSHRLAAVVERRVAAPLVTGMLVPMRLVLGALALAVGFGSSSADPVSALQASLPAGWRVVATRGALTIERTQPVKIAGQYLPNAESFSNVPKYAPPSAPTEILRLRYRTEPAWSATRLSQVAKANLKIYAELEPLRVKYQIDDIGTAKGMPLPKNPDEERRLHEYQAAYDKTLARITPVPRCTLGTLSVFDDATTYRQLDLMVDPPIAMREAYAVVELVKRRCR